MSSFHSIDSSTSDSSDSSLHASDLNDSPNSSVSSIHDIDPMQHAMLSTMRQMVDDSKRSTLAIVNAFSNSFANQSVSQLQMTQLLAASHLSQSITGDNKLMILSSLKPFDIQLFINEGTKSDEIKQHLILKQTDISRICDGFIRTPSTARSFVMHTDDKRSSLNI